MDKELENILKGNPFTEDLVDKWKNRLARHGAGSFGTDNQDDWFVLDGDTEAIAQYNARNGRSDTRRLHPEFIPQTFIGHPSAPVWLLTINPSWFESDVRSILRADSTRKQDQDLLRARQEVMLDQLLLRDGATFFPLVIKDGRYLFEVSDAGDMYSWWNYAVRGSSEKNFPLHGLSAEDVSQKLFVMEALPYRSSKWDERGMFRLSRSYDEFWTLLVKYACTHGKMLLVRAAESDTKVTNKIAKRVMEIANEIGGDKINAMMFGFRNVQSVSLSNGNVAAWPDESEVRSEDRKGFGIILNDLLGSKQQETKIELPNKPERCVEEVLKAIKDYGRHNLLRDGGVEERKGQGHARRAPQKHQPNDAGNGAAGKRLFRIPEGEYQCAEVANISTIMRHVAKRYLDLNPDKSRLDFLNLFRGGVNEGMVPNTEDWREKTKQSVEAIVFSGKGGSRLGEKILHGLKIRFCGN